MTRKILLVAIAILAVVAAAPWILRPRIGPNAPSSYQTLQVERGDLKKVVDYIIEETEVGLAEEAVPTRKVG